MSRAWYVLDRKGRVLAGPFTGEAAERKALNETWRLLREATRRGEYIGMLSPTPLPVTIGDPVMTLFTSKAHVPPNVWVLQAQGRLIVVQQEDGTAGAFG